MDIASICLWIVRDRCETPAGNGHELFSGRPLDFNAGRSAANSNTEDLRVLR
jgi:hypothetical protein